MNKIKDRHYYKTKKRLDHAQEWMDSFLETKKQLAISERVTHELSSEAPMVFKMAQLVMLPTICLTYLNKILVWRSFKKCKKEIQLIRKELETYE